jgi:hypothetical protein
MDKAMEKIKTEVNGARLRTDGREVKLVAKHLSFVKAAVFSAAVIVPWAKRMNASVLNSSFKMNQIVWQ